MIIVRLMGGLGNQMFQYAAGRRLAHVRQVPLKLDLSFYDHQQETNPNDTPRHYSLEQYCIQEAFASPADLKPFALGWKRSLPARLWRRLRRMLPFPSAAVYWQRWSGFDPAVLSLGGDVYLSGYWQSWKYFADIAGTIRQDFRLREPLHPTNQRLADEIRASNAVGLHVRRGDYVANPVTAAYHGSCNLDYYQRALSIVAGNVPQPHLFIFSDDPPWARDNLAHDLLSPDSQGNGSRISIVDNRDIDRDYEDLHLMSLCRHFVIANSSFSWWAAWLGTCPEKVVIAPQRWFADPSDEPVDLVPPEWVRI